ncbi:hypothetical protein [Mycolicibacterium elephantis]|uniref:hypothetical protein n=1 Tax=Mycolicibacterium elephantis TaxID=81858 RepID=UPI0013F4D791|nr:hypothetical protein [Mycolicibacterium elephantis]
MTSTNLPPTEPHTVASASGTTGSVKPPTNNAAAAHRNTLRTLPPHRFHLSVAHNGVDHGDRHA